MTDERDAIIGRLYLALVRETEARVALQARIDAAVQAQMIVKDDVSGEPPPKVKRG